MHSTSQLHERLLAVQGTRCRNMVCVHNTAQLHARMVAAPGNEQLHCLYAQHITAPCMAPSSTGQQTRCLFRMNTVRTAQPKLCARFLAVGWHTHSRSTRRPTQKHKVPQTSMLWSAHCCSVMHKPPVCARPSTRVGHITRQCTSPNSMFMCAAQLSFARVSPQCHARKVLHPAQHTTYWCTTSSSTVHTVCY